MNIVALSGSLRADSFNSRLLKEAGKLLPAGSQFTLLSTDLPLYSEELEGEHTPEVINHFKQTIDNADALLISSPEYNGSFSGVIKNALDWASRPAFESPLKAKPIGLLSASPSPLGGVRAQTALRPTLASTLSEVFPGLEFSLPAAHNAFDENGQLSDETALRRLKRFVESFVAWSERFQTPKQ